MGVYTRKSRAQTGVDLRAVDNQTSNTDRKRSRSMPFPTHTQAQEPLNSSDTNMNTSEERLSPVYTPPDSSDLASLTSCLAPLSEPVPEDWVVIEDEFLTVCAVYQSHLGPDLMATPAARMNDGLVYLLVVRAPLTRAMLFTLMSQMETGAHVDNEKVEIIPIRAFRLEPLSPGGNIAVDGEKVKYGPVQGEVIPGLARLMCR